VLGALNKIPPIQVETLEEIEAFHQHVVNRLRKDWAAAVTG
jgi:hypothetical protein